MRVSSGELLPEGEETFGPQLAGQLDDSNRQHGDEEEGEENGALWSR